MGVVAEAIRHPLYDLDLVFDALKRLLPSDQRLWLGFPEGRAESPRARALSGALSLHSAFRYQLHQSPAA